MGEIIMIMDRDKLIIAHLEKYKYATIDQLEKIFFKVQKNSYNIARRRMAEIIDAGYALRIRDPEINKVVYIYNDGKTKTPNRHRLLTLDALSNLHQLGFSVKEFEVEKSWNDGKVRSDAFTVFTLENTKNRYQYFIEVHLSNNDCNLEKYDILYETNEVQEYLGRNVYPRILLVTEKDVDYSTNYCKVVKVNTNFDELVSAILP